MSPKQMGGHPANKDPMVAKLTRTTTASVELVRDLRGLDPGMLLTLKAASLGLLWVMSVKTGMPSPMAVTSTPMKSLRQIKAEVWDEGMAAAKLANLGIKPAQNPYLEES